ncbi:hypothetical protein HK405_013409, partial [Cladochytrium tenue]
PTNILEAWKLVLNVLARAPTPGAARAAVAFVRDALGLPAFAMELRSHLEVQKEALPAVVAAMDANDALVVPMLDFSAVLLSATASLSAPSAPSASASTAYTFAVAPALGPVIECAVARSCAVLQEAEFSASAMVTPGLDGSRAASKRFLRAWLAAGSPVADPAPLKPALAAVAASVAQVVSLATAGRLDSVHADPAKVVDDLDFLRFVLEVGGGKPVDGTRRSMSSNLLDPAALSTALAGFLASDSAACVSGVSVSPLSPWRALVPAAAGLAAALEAANFNHGKARTVSASVASAVASSLIFNPDDPVLVRSCLAVIAACSKSEVLVDAFLRVAASAADRSTPTHQAALTSSTAKSPVLAVVPAR